jgi:hypothetical protein
VGWGDEWGICGSWWLKTQRMEKYQFIAIITRGCVAGDGWGGAERVVWMEGARWGVLDAMGAFGGIGGEAGGNGRVLRFWMGETCVGGGAEECGLGKSGWKGGGAGPL